MPDFHQPVQLPTLHHLADTQLAEREALMEKYTAKQPVAVVIPALYSELERDALPAILREVSKVPYVSTIVVSMNRMDAAQHRHAQEFFKRRLRGKTAQILWNDGPSLQTLHRELDPLTGMSHPHGKGSNVWMGLAWLLASGHRGVIACHDSDILNYDREMLWKLCMPVAHPEMDYVFSKSYYGRVRGRMYGRVTRLLVFPLLQALRELFGSMPLLSFLASFRYPLSGEFAADAGFICRLGLAADWGLEIGFLCELFRHAPAQRICQVDLGNNFDHKHQHLGTNPKTGEPDATGGLMRMAEEVTRSLLSHLWTQPGFASESRRLETVADAYLGTAQQFLRRYGHEMVFNGLEDSVPEEKRAVAAFAKIVRECTNQFHAAPRMPLSLPPWSVVERELPGFGERLREAANV